MAGRRKARLNEQVKRELTQLIQFEVRDPRIGMITLLDVEVSPDLYHAKVFYNVHGDEDERSKANEGLRAAAGFLRTELGKRMHIRRAPELHFKYDDTLTHAMHIERLIKEARATTSTQADADVASGRELDSDDDELEFDVELEPDDELEFDVELEPDAEDDEK